MLVPRPAAGLLQPEEQPRREQRRETPTQPRPRGRPCFGTSLGLPAEREQARQAKVSCGIAQLLAYAAMQQAAINSGKARSTA